MPTWEVRFDLRVDLRDADLIRKVARAEATAEVIRGLPIPPYIRERLDTLNILRAIRGTTAIEGSDLTEDEVRAVIDHPDEPAPIHRSRAREVQEVRNAKAAMDLIEETSATRPGLSVTEHFVCLIHQLLTRDIPYPHNEPGRYRSHAVAVGGYVPPRTGQDVRALMARFIDWLNDPVTQGWPAVVRATAAHFYLISIHPFGDGNGRTARAVESYLLYQAHINACGFYSLSNFYYRNRSEYTERLDNVRFRSRGSLMSFLAFAVTGLLEELEDVRREIVDEMSVIAFRDYAREQLTRYGRIGTKGGERQLLFVLEMGRDPVPLKLLREGGHPLAVLYKDVTSKTLSRDLTFLERCELVVRDDSSVQANLAVMDAFKLGSVRPGLGREGVVIGRMSASTVTGRRRPGRNQRPGASGRGGRRNDGHLR
ncbi:MAG TPA: Fic family protein [Candidatus Dormibacteraeota bacterium]|jgi:Fic family protein|nr:Fic family protein [Candidatus Dormibacteraeota bacterium]